MESRGFLFKIGPEESTFGSAKYKKVEYSRRRSERQMGMLKVSISVKSNMVNSNKF